MYPLLVCGGSLAVNGALVALSTLAAVRGSTDRAAAYELVLSLFYALQLTLTWRAAANVMIVLSSGFKEWMESGVLPRLVLALVLLLLLMQARNPSSSNLVGPLFRSYLAHAALFSRLHAATHFSLRRGSRCTTFAA